MVHNFKLLVASVALAASGFLFTGCSPQPTHPNQLNKFDGLAYDSLILAHGSISSLRNSVANQYPSLTPDFNKVAQAYDAAILAYSTYRTGASTEYTTSVALHELTLSIVALESQFELLFHGNTLVANKLSAKAQTLYSPSELLTVLQLSAAVASAVPGLQDKLGAVQVILSATAQALSEWKAMASAPIDINNLTPIEALS